MKHIVSSNEIGHLWAHQTQDWAAQKIAWEARDAKHREESKEIYQKWLQGENNGYSGYLHLHPTALRIKGDTVETSMGANFPVSHARRGLVLVDAVVASGQPWQSNGHSCHLGHYTIDRIDADGTVHAGCHHVSLEAINRIREAILASPAPQPETVTN